jgi:N utilization substance protein A
MVVNELKGEKIDVVPWSDDAATLVANALQPAKVKEVRIDPDTQTALVIVPDYQLSLAIGREGQNARLAARLTGWRIDIKSETQIAEDSRAPAPAPAEPATEPAVEPAAPEPAAPEPAAPEAKAAAPEPETEPAKAELETSEAKTESPEPAGD